MNSDTVPDHGAHQSSPRLEYKWCASAMQPGSSPPPLRDLPRVASPLLPGAHLTSSSGLGRASTQSQLTSCFTPECCRANSQHTGEWNPGLADGLSCFTEVLELLLVRWDEQIDNRLFSLTGVHFPSYSKVFLLSILLHSQLQHKGFF